MIFGLFFLTTEGASMEITPFTGSPINICFTDSTIITLINLAVVPN